jgi:aldose sugar dehydrogenase
VVAQGLVLPWSIVLLPDAGGALVTERPGRIRRLTPHGPSAPLRGVPAVVNLLDAAADADFSTSSRLFVSMVRLEGDEAALEVWAGRLEAHAWLDARRIYRAAGRYEMHPVLHAGRLLVLAPFSLLVSVADRDDRRSRAQDAASHAGKIVHLRGDAPPRVVARGVRNVQGFAQAGRDIWFTDHGPRGGDELNRLAVDADYGWPLVSLGSHYDGTRIASAPPPGSSVLMPVAHWSPSIAPSSLAAYAGDELREWQGSLLLGSLAGRHVRRLELRDGVVAREEVLLAHLRERIRDVRVDQRGRVYVLTDGLHGRVLRITRRRKSGSIGAG